LADGRRAFVKVVGPEPNPDSADLYRQEARIAASIPPEAPMPPLLWHLDQDGWVTLAFDDVDGRHPAVPWRPEDLDRVLAALRELARDLTPSPIDAPTLAETFGDRFDGWRSFARGKVRPSDPWAASNLDRLADLESGWEAASAGSTLLHADLRADNILLTDDRAFIVDWPHASIGAPWVDLLFMLPSVAMQGGPDPWVVFDAEGWGASAEPSAVDAVLAAVAGYFLWHAELAAPPGLPTVRAFQRAQGEQALRWLRVRLEGADAS
jgi:aminoglycoside phosphotransferase (APT) family kinase protein